MKVVSLFSGAGGLDLGFIMAGHTIIWANDLYEDAVETYRKNIGDHIICEDISNFCLTTCCNGFCTSIVVVIVKDTQVLEYLFFVLIYNRMCRT